ncbi:N-acetylmuramoyl-L-alanine amidase [Desulfospira joergensenii]|uniref:N-acetylmuramoyl-L-alanine amidase n=1 Tax=Desulfospira joergensenii TaxID=53329 RepID=UPI0003F69488|nr:peptidoglycan recognition family protein [Desulfospira joergensenii]
MKFKRLKRQLFTRWAVLCFAALCMIMIHPEPAPGFTNSEYRRFQAGIINYQNRLNKKFRKIRRKQTRYIIVHTSELGLKATLRVVSRGKQFKSGFRTPGGHANYVIARNGRVYRIMNKAFRADHAGRSMWNRQKDISSVSLGIELVGYHYAPLTDRQYRSAAMLIDILQKVYNLSDLAVLTHSQIAYGLPNPWFRKDHRGRKRCAKNFDRARAGLGPTWSHDPDVRAGLLMPDPQLDSLFYKKSGSVRILAQASNLISKENSAWSIAGEDYDSQTTVYILPGGKALPGDRVKKIIGWSHLPVNTRVLLNQDTGEKQASVPDLPVKIISTSMTAWSHAGQAYKEKTTVYFLPSGKTRSGAQISDWDDLPIKTRLIIGYQGPHKITKDRTAYRIAGSAYKSEKTVYHFPSGRVTTGNKVKDFSQLPRGTEIYLPL